MIIRVACASGWPELEQQETIYPPATAAIATSNSMALATFSNGWLNFELSVLRRLKFTSVALPFTGEPNLGLQLKRWQVRVAVNDPMSWSFTKATATVENNSERLSAEEIETLLEDAYVSILKNASQSPRRSSVRNYSRLWPWIL